MQTLSLFVDVDRRTMMTNPLDISMMNRILTRCAELAEHDACNQSLHLVQRQIDSV